MRFRPFRSMLLLTFLAGLASACAPAFAPDPRGDERTDVLLLAAPAFALECHDASIDILRVDAEVVDGTLRVTVLHAGDVLAPDLRCNDQPFPVGAQVYRASVWAPGQGTRLDFHLLRLQDGPSGCIRVSLVGGLSDCIGSWSVDGPAFSFEAPLSGVTADTSGEDRAYALEGALAIDAGSYERASFADGVSSGATLTLSDATDDAVWIHV